MMHTPLELFQNRVLRVEFITLIHLTLLAGYEQTSSQRFGHLHIEHIVREQCCQR